MTWLNCPGVIATLGSPMRLHLVQSLSPLEGIRGIDIEEDSVPARGADGRDDLLHVRQGGATIKMHAEDIQPTTREFAAGGFTKAAG